MEIKKELDRRFLAAMRARDRRVSDTIRAVRALVTEETKKTGFEGEVDEALYAAAIGRYVKQLQKALPEFERAGDAGAETVAAYRWEIEYFGDFLPKKIGEDETRALVREVIAQTGADSPKQLGRVMGAVMKDHRDEVDAGLVRQLAEEELS